MESILVVDCGSTTTRAVLIDVVEGRFRFVARGETASSLAGEADVMGGVQEAIRQIESITGRSFIGKDGNLITPERIDGNGVDAFLAVHTNFKLVPASGILSQLGIALDTGDTLKLDPAQHRTDGFFAAVLERCA